MTSFDGFGPADSRDSGPGGADTGGPSKDAAAGDVEAGASDSNPSDAPILNPSCKNDLSNIGTADFTISMTVTTTQSGTVALANQRMVCNVSAFWDVHLQDGAVEAETDDALQHHNVENTTAPLVNDGKPHTIVVQRRNEVLMVIIDGTVAGTTACLASFGLLTVIETETSPCVGHTGYYSLVGTLSDVCVTSP
jgi:Laminin G domain